MPRQSFARRASLLASAGCQKTADLTGRGTVDGTRSGGQPARPRRPSYRQTTVTVPLSRGGILWFVDK